MTIRAGIGSVGRVGRCGVLLENETSISIKLVSRRKMPALTLGFKALDLFSVSKVDLIKNVTNVQVLEMAVRFWQSPLRLSTSFALQSSQSCG